MQPVKLFHADNVMRTGFNRYACHFVPPRLTNFVKSANKIVVLFFGFPQVAILISNRFECHISNEEKEEKKSDKFIIFE